MTLEQALAYLKPADANNGTISLRAPKAREAVAVIAAEIAALQSREGLIAFAREIIEPAFDGMDVDGDTIQSLALTHGLLSKTTCDPEKHGPSMEAEPGDEWYALAGPLALAEQEKGDA